MQKIGEQPTPGVEPAQVRQALRAVIDPEVGVNIVDLALIYEIEVSGTAIRVRMTTTARFCPMGGMVADEAQTVLGHRFPGRRIDVDLVWTPRWRQDMVSPIAWLELSLAP